MTRGLVAIEAAAALCLAATARGETLHLAARLTAAAGAPISLTSATGNLWADLDPHSRLFTYRLTYRRLSGPATGARLRGPTKTGELAAATAALDISPSPVTGKVTLTAAEAADVERGRWYVEIATSANPRGEIGGQLKSQDDEREAMPSTDRPDQAPQSSQLGWSPQLSW
jgi:hypothetical protein